MTKRFEPVSNHASSENILENKEGDFVHYSDYEVLLIALRRIAQSNPGYQRSTAVRALDDVGEKV